MFLFIILILIILFAIAKNIFVVKQQENVIIERLGKYNRILKPGLHVKIPFIERIATTVGLRTEQTSFTIDAKTEDNVTITMEIAAQHFVTDPYKAYYKLREPIVQMKSYLIDALRSSIPSYTLDDVFAKKNSIASDVNSTVREQMTEYGFNLVSTLITSIILPKDVENSMNKINSAQREKQAAQSLAEAEKIKIVTEATAHAEAMEQAGIGIAKQRKAIAEGISGALDEIKRSGVNTEEANTLFLFTQWSDMMGEFAKQKNGSTIVLPANFNETRSMFEHMVVAEKSITENDKG